MKLSIFVFTCAAGILLSSQVFAGEGGMGCPWGMSESKVLQLAKADGVQGQITQEAVEADNKICPISGEKIVPGKEVKIEYSGKVYNLCCSMCAKDFNKDPEAAIRKLGAAQEAK